MSLVDDVEVAHAYCHHNRGMTGQCGCFYCEATFDASEITEWAGDDAICPKCHVDSVLPGDKVRIDPEFLETMQLRWFDVEDDDEEADCEEID